MVPGGEALQFRDVEGVSARVAAAPTPFAGAAFGLAYVSGLGQRTVIATGPGGAAVSSDEGGSWTSLPGVENYWAVAFANRTAGWLVGTDGRILKISF